MNPFLGTWVANLEKSRRHANHQFQSATLTFEVSGNVVSLTHAGVNMSGKRESGTTSLEADGLEHAVSPLAPGVIAVTTWVGTHVLSTKATKDGRPVGAATYEVSTDGATLTATVEGIDAAGQAFDQVIVFDGGRADQIDRPVNAMDLERLKDFGARYTAAWCSQSASSVASFFHEGGSLTINDGPPSVGRASITAAAQGFMTAFPDMVVTMDDLSVAADRAIYKWTLTGTNTGPGGSGKPVRISGFEEWTFGRDGLIAESKGRFNEAEYNRQLQSSTTEPARK